MGHLEMTADALRNQDKQEEVVNFLKQPPDLDDPYNVIAKALIDSGMIEATEKAIESRPGLCDMLARQIEVLQDPLSYVGGLGNFISDGFGVGGPMHSSYGRTAEECLMQTVSHLEAQEQVTLSKEDKTRILRLLAKSSTRKESD